MKIELDIVVGWTWRLWDKARLDLIGGEMVACYAWPFTIEAKCRVVTIKVDLLSDWLVLVVVL